MNIIDNEELLEELDAFFDLRNFRFLSSQFAFDFSQVLEIRVEFVRELKKLGRTFDRDIATCAYERDFEGYNHVIALLKSGNNIGILHRFTSLDSSSVFIKGPVKVCLDDVKTVLSRDLGDIDGTTIPVFQDMLKN